MRISADCIDEEFDNQKEEPLSDQFARMALNDNKSAEDIRVIYKVNYSSIDNTVSLSVIPVTDSYGKGYQSSWSEIKQQVKHQTLCCLFLFICDSLALNRYWT